MSAASAVAFLERLENDQEFTDKIQSLNSDPVAVYNAVKEAGFDVSPEDIQSVFLERYGSELSPDQLDVISGGYASNGMFNIGEWNSTTVIATGAGIAGGVIFAVAAAAAVG